MVKDHSDSKWGNPLPPKHGFSFRLATKVPLYAQSHRQDSTYHGFYYTSYGALAGMRNSSMGLPWRINPTTHRTMSGRSTTQLHLAPCNSLGRIVSWNCRFNMVLGEGNVAQWYKEPLWCSKTVFNPHHRITEYFW